MRHRDVIGSLEIYLSRLRPDDLIYSARRLEQIMLNKEIRKRADVFFGVGFNGRSNQYLGQHIINRDQYIITYYGKDEDDTREVIDDIESRIDEIDIIPGYLVDYRFRELRAAIKTPDVGPYLTRGDCTNFYKIAFTGITADEQETRLSDPSLRVHFYDYDDIRDQFRCNGNLIRHVELPEYYVNVSDNNKAIQIQFPKLPIDVTMFESYNIYIDDDGNNTPTNLKEWQLLKTVVHEDPTCNQGAIIDSFDTVAPYVSKNNIGRGSDEDEDEVICVPFFNITVLKTMSDTMQHEHEDFWYGYILVDVYTGSFVEDKNEFVIRSVTPQVNLS